MSDATPSSAAPRLSAGPPDSSLAFEALLARISRRFITLPLGEFGPAIVRTLGEIGRFMQADRCFVFLPTEDRAVHYVAHMWTARQIADDPIVVGTVVREAFPWVHAGMCRHEDIVVPRVDDLPPEARRELEYCRQTGIQSFLMCPMYSAEAVVGNLGLDAIRARRDWSDTDRRRLRLFGEVVAAEICRFTAVGPPQLPGTTG